jgi:hypothetical protein
MMCFADQSGRFQCWIKHATFSLTLMREEKSNLFNMNAQIIHLKKYRHNIIILCSLGDRDGDRSSSLGDRDGDNFSSLGNSDGDSFSSLRDRDGDSFSLGGDGDVFETLHTNSTLTRLVVRKDLHYLQ